MLDGTCVKMDSAYWPIRIGGLPCSDGSAYMVVLPLYYPLRSTYVLFHRKLESAVGLSIPLYERIKVDLSLSVFNTCSGTNLRDRSTSKLGLYLYHSIGKASGILLRNILTRKNQPWAF